MISETMTVRELIQAYRAADTPRRGEDDRHALWWMDQIGDLSVMDLASDLIHRQVHTLIKRGRSQWTANFYLRFFRRVCAWGALMGHLAGDPCTTIPLPKDKPSVLRVLTEEEERALCAALGEPYGLWVRFAILTGLKQSEQFTLRWRDVDLNRNTLLIPHPQTGAVVALSLSPAAVAVLRELRRIQPASLWVFPDLRSPTRPANVHSFYVGRWETAIRRAQITWCAWKDLRHTCGVRLAKQGVPIEEVMALLRQREVRQAYVYRAWQPGKAHVRQPVRKRAAMVFTDLSPDVLRQQLGRDATSDPLTFREICHLYAAHHLKDRPSRERFEGIFRQFWQPWADRLPETISRKEVRLWYMSLERIPAHANKAATFLRSLYNWALRMELLTCANPSALLIRFRQDPRERFMDTQEVHRFMEGLPHLPAKPRAFLLLLLFTGARMGEALKMRWADVDSATRLWRKPRTKNGTSHYVPLPIQVMEGLAPLPRSSEWVFPGVHGRHWARASAQKTWQLIRARWNLNEVHLHDIRRTCASYLAIDGQNLPTIQAVLNHRSLAPTSIYARLNTKAVDRALQAQADRFCGLMSGPEVLPALPQELAPLQLVGASESQGITPFSASQLNLQEWPG